MTKAEEDFMDEYVRSMLPAWGDASMRLGDMDSLPIDALYIERALANGWITTKLPRRLTAKGFSAAASFLRR